MRNINKIAAILTIALIFFLAWKRYIFDENKLSSASEYAVATVYNIFYPVEGDPDAEFEYKIDKTVYKGYNTFNPDEYDVVVGKNFLLKYYSKDPKIARIFLDKPLDSLQIVNLSK